MMLKTFAEGLARRPREVVWDAVVIGGGVVGIAVLRELVVNRGLARCLLLERDSSLISGEG